MPRSSTTPSGEGSSPALCCPGISTSVNGCSCRQRRPAHLAHGSDAILGCGDTSFRSNNNRLRLATEVQPMPECLPMVQHLLSRDEPAYIQGTGQSSTCSLRDSCSRRRGPGVWASTVACSVARHALSRPTSSPSVPGNTAPYMRAKQCEMNWFAVKIFMQCCIVGQTCHALTRPTSSPSIRRNEAPCMTA